MSDPTVYLKPRKERPVLLGHPWLFSGAIADCDRGLTPGTIVVVRTAQGELMGRGYINLQCSIAVRMLTHEDELVDAPFFHRRVAGALALRRGLIPPDTTAYRALNGEGDFLPGFVADVYGSVVVLQCLTAGAARLKSHIVAALQAELPETAGIYERSAGAVRRDEGLEPQEGVLAGEVPIEPTEIRECGLRFTVDFRSGQKTGFFLDQRDNRILARQLARSRAVFNGFGYTGAFTVYAGAGKARHVVTVESSARALTFAARNWACNGLDASCAEFVEADVFRFLRETDRTFDLLVLDPPALVKRRAELARGARAYKDLHLWAFRCAAPAAHVMTFSCSQHVSTELFWKIVQGAARDARRAVRVLRHLGPGADHPTSLAHPEGEYLKGFLLHVS